MMSASSVYGTLHEDDLATHLASLTQVADHITGIITNGSHNQRKALIVEIKIA